MPTAVSRHVAGGFAQAGGRRLMCSRAACARVAEGDGSHIVVRVECAVGQKPTTAGAAAVRGVRVVS